MPARNVIALLLPLLAAPTAADDTPPPAIEELIRFSRERGALHREALASRVTEILARAGMGEDEAVVQSLIALGPPAARTLFAHLSPTDGEAGAPRRARLAARALQRIGAASCRDDLLRLLREGPAPARVHAAAVLGSVPGPESVQALLEVLASEDGSLRRAAIGSLGELRAKEASGRIAAFLSQADPEGTKAILGALKSIGAEDALPAVAAFLERPEAIPHLADLLDYVVAVKGRLALPPILRLLHAGTLPPAETIRLVQAVAAIATSADREALAVLRDQLDEEKVRSWDVRAEAAYALYALGDDSGAKGLLKQYQSWITSNPRLANPYAGRGRVYLRLGKWGEALRDLQEAIRLVRGDNYDPEWYVDAARALCRLHREREAVAMLRRSGFSAAERVARFRGQPDFEELSANEKYRAAWED